MKTRIFLLTFLATVGMLRASTRTSANYSITTDIADSGGAAAASANYATIGSIGTVAGISTVASPVEFAKAGYLGQLYDLTSTYTLGASQTTVNEGGTVQLGLFQQADDASYLLLPANSATWSVASGPLTGIDSNGLATAGLVYQDTAATARAQYLSQTLTLGLTVLDTIPDNYGSYAGDGLPDSWQVQYFGLNNPQAAPNADADGTGQTNLFKYTAGLNPTDGSRFMVTIAPVNGQPTRKAVIFLPVVSGRTYTVQTSPDLSNWQSLTGSTQSDNGSTRTVTDLNASGLRKFYRVQVSKP